MIMVPSDPQIGERLYYIGNHPEELKWIRFGDWCVLTKEWGNAGDLAVVDTRGGATIFVTKAHLSKTKPEMARSN